MDIEEIVDDFILKSGFSKNGATVQMFRDGLQKAYNKGLEDAAEIADHVGDPRERVFVSHIGQRIRKKIK